MERDHLDNLDELLRRADGVAGAPPKAADLAGRVRRRHVRRRRLRAAVGTTAVAICLVAGVWQIGLPSRSGPGPDSSHVSVAVAQPVDVVAIRSELNALRLEADRHEAAAARMLVREQRRNTGSATRLRLAAEPPIDVAWQREQAALVLVRQGDRLSQEFNLPEPAALAYRQASETFPGTHWGGVARQRLTKSN